MTTQPLRFGMPDDREELARAEAYGVLARLFYAAPDAGLHERLRLAPTEAPARGAFLESSWTDLVGATRRLMVADISTEYADLFIGVGKPELFLCGSHYLAGALHERPLAALRDSLNELGLARADDMHETEDHIAYLCEVMRFLIAADDPAFGHLAVQRRFFDAHLRPWTEALCEAVAGHPRADFYRSLASFARAFFAVESQAFDMLD